MRTRTSPKRKGIMRPTADGSEFRLAYARTGPVLLEDQRTQGTPMVVIPGGPGVGSLVPYASLMSWAERSNIDLIMVEHRGVGFSRKAAHGKALTQEDMWLRLVVEDIEQVLNAEGIRQAVIYGASYGSYVAQLFAVTHPERVSGLVLDSPVMGAGDYADIRAHARDLFWDGTHEPTSKIAEKLRCAVEAGCVDQVALGLAVRMVFNVMGEQGVAQLALLACRRSGARLINALPRAHRLISNIHGPFVVESTPVGTIAYRELNYAPAPDGLPFDPGTEQAEDAESFPSFQGESADLWSQVPELHVPIAILSGAWDLVAPPPNARKLAERCPQAQLIEVPGAGHSFVDARSEMVRELLQVVGERGVEGLREHHDRLEDLGAKVPPFSMPRAVRLLLGSVRIMDAMSRASHGWRQRMG
ncbi:alpha/beta fold hydrolase [Corynebacterium heidelbergense]|uniref:AB hydrolase-1 domain-containing protein n=1 Tax=Corynebacterium heidelbergense TaxID=2055947 RepID=A0A364VC01_9CORY|nr:alpha/beta fold hydrolase [Corynebacterium heidelbergense]RAV34167.1 hypothetical protein CWC39_04765 [Corynebacterium heidelbergense]WCZ37602.1 Proline iminopeptidase [Corynebacterium heidelbergense]